MPRCCLALGGNLGDVEQAFARALASLQSSKEVSVIGVSSVHRTRPVGQSAGGEFANAAATIETSLEPLQLLDRLQDLEKAAGRAKSGIWEPRPLDLDIVFYADKVIAHPRLQIPHPASWYRRFVLDPLSEIAGEVRHPVKGLTVGGLRRRLLPKPFHLGLTGGTSVARKLLRQSLSDVTSDVQITEWQPGPQSDGREPAILAWLGRCRSDSEQSIAFEKLPVVPRLDVSHLTDAAGFLSDVLRSAVP